ncbi:tetratricopeptide repeat protein [Qipengyuania sp. SM2507]
MRSIVLLVSALAAVHSLPAKAADWYLAETEHFKVYAEDTKSETEDFARDLERLDEVLRIISGVGPDDGSMPESSKVIVFRFGQTKDMASLAGAPRSGIGGFFIPRASGSYAFVPRRKNLTYSRSNQGRMQGLDLEPKAVLFHEYVHYFMYQHRNAPYPAWYREGFAEIFSTLRSEGDRFVIGDAPTWRSVEIMAVDLDIEKMIDPPEKGDRYTVARTYGHGWLLASLLNFTPERRPQITEYVTLLAEGKPRLEAAKEAFGDLDELEKEMDRYRRGAAKVLKANYISKEPPAVSIRKLTEAEEARIDLMIQSKVGVDEKAAAKQLPEARQLLASYPDSVPVLLAAAEVEFDNKNYTEAEALFDKVLSIEAETTEAVIGRAQTALMQSQDNPAMLIEARNRFITANNMENDHPVPLFGYYLTYALSDEEAPASAQAALESAYQYAPFDTSIRTTLAHMFLVEGRPEITKSLLNPLIQTAHGTRMAKCLNSELEKYESGDTAPLLERLKPEHPAAEDDDEDEAEEEDNEDESEDADPCAGLD